MNEKCFFFVFFILWPVNNYYQFENEMQKRTNKAPRSIWKKKMIWWEPIGL